MDLSYGYLAAPSAVAAVISGVWTRLSGHVVTSFLLTPFAVAFIVALWAINFTEGKDATGSGVFFALTVVPAFVLAWPGSAIGAFVGRELRTKN